jgi:hypothetical protein
MSDYIYRETSESTSPNFARPNNITIARALGGKYLTKIVYANSEKAYDNAYHYMFFNREIFDLFDLRNYLPVLLRKPDCCLIRGIAKDDTITRQVRRLHDKDGVTATIIEQPQNWYALDIDGYGNSSGDLKQDAQSVLLALGLDGTEALAIPSAGYLRKPGIRIRLFLWNEMKVSCISLKKHFERWKHVVDLALFHPIQPIYTARPIFNGMSDPCKESLICWLPGRQSTHIVERYSIHDNSEMKHTVKQAKAFLNSFIKEMPNIPSGERHNYLTGKMESKAVLIGKCVAQGLLDEGETKDEILVAAKMFWHGNAKNDSSAIDWVFKRGQEAMESE